MNIKEIKEYLKRRPKTAKEIFIQKIHKGWSNEEKYYIETDISPPYLLRLSSKEGLERKKREHSLMKELHRQGLPISVPIELVVSKNSSKVFHLLSWIDGRPLDEVIETLSLHDQYKLGIEAGMLLKEMHSLKAPPTQIDWEERMLKKFSVHHEKYRSAGVRVKNEEKALYYLKKNLHLLKDRPQVFQHGDFHIGNLILTKENQLGVIDFNRWDYGDPYEEFYKMSLFSREKSIPFSRGQIHGYFGGDVPQDFFPLLALYLADVILYSVVWAIPFGEEEVLEMQRRAQMVLGDYGSFHTILPTWFHNNSFYKPDHISVKVP